MDPGWITSLIAPGIMTSEGNDHFSAKRPLLTTFDEK